MCGGDAACRQNYLIACFNSNYQAIAALLDLSLPKISVDLRKRAKNRGAYIGPQAPNSDHHHGDPNN